MSDQPKLPGMSALAQPLLMIGVVYFIKNNVDVEDPAQLGNLRIAYVCHLLFVWTSLAVIAYLSQTRGSSTEREKEVVDVQKDMSTGKEKKVTMMRQEYDMIKVKAAFGQSIMGMCILGFIHYKWQTVLPLAIQSVVQPLLFLKSPLAQAHFWGMDVKRPFDVPKNPLEGMMKEMKKMQEDQKKEKRAQSSKKTKKLTGSERRKQKREQ